MSNYNKTTSVAQQRLSGVFNPVFAGAYEKDSAILCSGKFYICVRDTVWLDKINADWREYTGQFIYNYQGSVEKLEDLPETAINGACLYVSRLGKTYAFNGQSWDPIEPTLNLDVYAKKDDLLGYITIENFDTELKKYVRKDDLNELILEYPTKEELEEAISEFVTNDELNSILKDYATNDILEESIADFVTDEKLTFELKNYSTIAATEQLISEVYFVGDYKYSAQKTDHGTWFLCDGRSLNKTEYIKLFNLIGYSFGGSGDTFNLPNANRYRYLANPEINTDGQYNKTINTVHWNKQAAMTFSHAAHSHTSYSYNIYYQNFGFIGAANGVYTSSNNFFGRETSVATTHPDINSTGFSQMYKNGSAFTGVSRFNFDWSSETLPSTIIANMFIKAK